VPYTSAFDVGEDSPELTAVDWIVDIAFMFDILLNFNTGYDKSEGEVVMGRYFM